MNLTIGEQIAVELCRLERRKFFRRLIALIATIGAIVLHWMRS